MALASNAEVGLGVDLADGDARRGYGSIEIALRSVAPPRRAIGSAAGRGPGIRFGSVVFSHLAVALHGEMINRPGRLSKKPRVLGASGQ